jgi:hypothetical protein
MPKEEIAPPFETWAEHLTALGDRELAELAKDYCWLEVEAQAPEQGPEFHRRREAVVAECMRRGMTAVAKQCQPPER